MAALEQVFPGVTAVRFYGSTAQNVMVERDSGEDRDLNISPDPIRPRGMIRNLELRNVRFTYPNATRPAVCDATLAIPVDTSVNFVRETGGGGSTLADMVLGLLRP